MADTPFDVIVQQIKEAWELAEISFTIDRGYLEPITDLLRPIVYFKIVNGDPLADVFFNGLSGYRAQYYESSSVGLRGNSYTFEILEEKLIQAAAAHRFQHRNGTNRLLEMSKETMLLSLRQPSAKVWGDECDGELQKIVQNIQQFEPQIRAERWMNHAHEGHPKALKGVKAPEMATLKFHGAFLNSQGEEVIPPGKENRSDDIHKYGFT